MGTFDLTMTSMVQRDRGSGSHAKPWRRNPTIPCPPCPVGSCRRDILGGRGACQISLAVTPRLADCDPESSAVHGWTRQSPGSNMNGPRTAPGLQPNVAMRCMGSSVRVELLQTALTDVAPRTFM